MKITDKIKTMTDVYAAKGTTESEFLPYANPETDLQKGVNAAAKLFLLAEVLNEGWKPDWNDNNQRKYYPWFDMEDSAGAGSGFSHDYYYVFSFSDFGSRLVFKTWELAKFAAEQFLEVYREFMTFQVQ